MRTILSAFFGICALVLAGCAGQSVFQGGTSLLAPIQNPVSRTTLAEVESAYGIVLTAAVAYRRLPLCRRGEVASATRLCADRGVILVLQAADRKARVALLSARSFVRNHPTLNAVDIILLAKHAVEDFQNVAAANRVVR